MVGNRTRRHSGFSWLAERVHRRSGPIFVSAAFFCLGLIYFFVWGTVGQHTQSLWISPQDLWITYFASSQLAHGHFGDIYQSKVSFVEFPGILIALAPFGALSNVFHTTVLEVTRNGALPAQGISLRAANIPFLNAQEFHFGATTYVSHPQWVAWVDPYALLLSCTALFACDALAERLQVPRPRRIVLCLAEAALLWNVTVWWGHPEDAVAVALAVYALIFVLDGRFAGAGWLFGAAVVFQPLVLLMLPILLAKAGRRHGIWFALRSVIPAGVLLAVPLIASPANTLRALLDQPSSPNVNHATPWTGVSPNLGGHGPGLTVAAGPVRVLAILLAIGLGVWVFRRWRERPELVVWACALALALRSYTESVMTDYYVWAALAVALVVAARASRLRFELAIAVAIATTVLAQWKLGWFPWWLIQVAGLTGLLIVASHPRLSPSRNREPGQPSPGPVGLVGPTGVGCSKETGREVEPPTNPCSESWSAGSAHGEGQCGEGQCKEGKHCKEQQGEPLPNHRGGRGPLRGEDGTHAGSTSPKRGTGHPVLTIEDGSPQVDWAKRTTQATPDCPLTPVTDHAAVDPGATLGR